MLIHNCETRLEDFKLFEKNAIKELHWSMEAIDRADNLRLNEIMQAREEKDRPQDPMALAKRLGLF